jgi:TolA-binding protein
MNRSTARVLAMAASALAAASMSVGCLTDGQARSVQSQVKEIRRQVDRVAAATEKEVSTLQATPQGNQEAGQSTEPLDSKPPPAPPSPPAPQPGSDRSQEAERLYREGYAMYHRGEQAAAEKSLRRSLELRPDGEAGATTRLLLADSLAALGRDREAIDALQPLIDGGRPPALAARALFGRALCLQRMGRSEAAREDFKAVLRKFPESDVAPLARVRLQAP